jgi:hypothetical protein
MRLSERWYLPVFLVLAGTLMVLALTGALDALASAVHDMPLGDAATWFTGLATTAVAVLAWRTSRQAVRAATYATEEQVKAEASRVTWWFEPHILPSTAVEADLVDLPPAPGSPSRENDPRVATEASGTAVLLVRNANGHPVGNVHLHVADERHVDVASLGTHSLGLLRPGTVRFRLQLDGAAASATEELVVRSRLAGNELAEWLEFTDSANRVWRRHADGSLHLQDRR